MDSQVLLIYYIMTQSANIEPNTQAEHAQFYLDYLIGRDSYGSFRDYRVDMVTKGMRKMGRRK